MAPATVIFGGLSWQVVVTFLGSVLAVLLVVVLAVRTTTEKKPTLGYERRPERRRPDHLIRNVLFVIAAVLATLMLLADYFRF